MKRLLKSILPATLLALGIGGSSQAQTYLTPTPDIYVVMFHASWCGPCKVVNPALDRALQNLNDPRIEYLRIDISSGSGDYNGHAVFDRGIVRQYNMWLGVTGFAAIIDGDTKRTMGCVNLTYDSDAMTMHIRNLQNAAQQNIETFDITCPEANNPV